MNIVADENLAFTDYFFSSFGEIQHKSGRQLEHCDVKHADALLIRSVTQVNESLIQHTDIKFIGSATIGTDHLDISAIENQNIHWSNAAGCNAQAVAEYVITAILNVYAEALHLEHKFTLGIVGLGNVGTRLAYMAGLLGWNVIGYDAFVTHENIKQVELENLLTQSDAISIHVPLTQNTAYPTYHLFNADTLQKIRPSTILINSARGAVIEEKALIADIQKTQRKVVLDVFEHEPIISEQLLDLVQLVTPHIAGYSLEGKARGTQMIYEAFCHHFHYEMNKRFETQLPIAETLFSNPDLKVNLAEHLKNIYNIQQDDHNLRACLKDGQIEQKAFDALRKNYPLRREWAAHGGPKA